MKLKIGEKVYDAAIINELSLKTILQLEDQMDAFGHPMKWTEVEAIFSDLMAMKTDAERAKHPAGIWITAITIWATRKAAGEDVTFDEAVDFPLSQLSYIAEPGDHLEPVNPTRPRPRKGSGAAGKARPKSAAKTSEKASTAA